MTPWLSVIMPVHNGARFLTATLQSVAKERPDGVEFLIYDSSDDEGACRRIVEEFESRLAIKYAPVPDIKPWQAKVNLGAAAATAAHIAILHQDDLWLSGHLKSVREALAACPQAAFSVGPSRFVDASGNDVGLWRIPLEPGPHDSAAVLEKLVVQNPIAVPSPVFCKAAWLAVGGMDMSLWYTPDWDVYLKLARHGLVMIRPEATTGFRLHSSSLTMTGSANIGEFRDQLEVVLTRHSPYLDAQAASNLLRVARAAIALNCALALASRGEFSALARAIFQVVRLGPVGAMRLIRDAGLIDRIRPRLHLLAQTLVSR